ncbi:MAG TPA: hypothetical protein VGH38_16145, partial [Bryobacteraceae bacterium]
MSASMNRLCRSAALVACVALVSAQSPYPDRFVRPRPGDRFPDALVQVSAASPFTAGCAGKQTGANYLNGPVEPFIAVDPNRPEHLVGVWQQDRWTNGGANGLLAAVSTDRGSTWTTSFAHFSICSGG